MAAIDNPRQDRSIGIHAWQNKLYLLLEMGFAASMILHVFVVVFLDGFVLMLGILSVMRGLYALGVCQRPQISTDHVHVIGPARKSNAPNGESKDGSMVTAEPWVCAILSTDQQAESVGLWLRLQ
jgi:hypothetical protein